LNLKEVQNDIGYLNDDDECVKSVMIQKFILVWFSNQKFVITEYESCQEEVHIKCTSNN
jgi:hypothetical protein